MRAPLRLLAVLCLLPTVLACRSRAGGGGPTNDDAAAPADAPPSDERFLAARAPIATGLGRLFDANAALLAPHPEGSGMPTRSAFVSSVPDLTDFVTAAKPTLPAPTARLAGCHAATRAALDAFGALVGPTLGEGKMGGSSLTPDQRYTEALRQLDATRAAYCHWRDAARVCHAEAGTAIFEPRYLECPESPAGALAAPDAGSTTADVSGVTIAVDARIELMAILGRLAGQREYAGAPRSPYTDAVDAHFAPHREHAAVRMTQELRRTHSIGFDAPMTLAVYLDATYRPIRPLVPRPPGLDARFDGAPVDDYLAAIQDFARASGYDAFFAAQAPFHDAVAARLRDHLHATPVVPWFDGVFGKRERTRYLMAPSALVSPRAYGVRAVHPGGEEDIVQVMFLEGPDAAGLPTPGDRTLEILVHEIAHSYVNPLLEAHMPALEPAFLPLFQHVEAAMKKQAYNVYTIALNESVVRAVTILFLAEHAPAHARVVMVEERKRSFLWIAELTAALASVRAIHGGALPADALVAASRDTFTRWAKAHLAPARP